MIEYNKNFPVQWRVIYHVNKYTLHRIDFVFSQSTEDSDPLYDQPSRYHHGSDSEPERPSSTSPPPNTGHPSADNAQNGEHLVRPSVVKLRSNTNAGRCDNSFVHIYMLSGNLKKLIWFLLISNQQ